MSKWALLTCAFRPGQCTSSTHQHFTIALWHFPSRAMYPANSSYGTGEQLADHIPLPFMPVLSRRKALLNVYQDRITFMINWHHCIGGDVPLRLNFIFMLACPRLFSLKVDVDKMPDLKGKQSKFNLKKTFIWSSFKSHSLTDKRQLSPLHISSLHQRPHTLSHGQWDFPITNPFGQTSVQADEDSHFKQTDL